MLFNALVLLQVLPFVIATPIPQDDSSIQQATVEPPVNVTVADPQTLEAPVAIPVALPLAVMAPYIVVMKENITTAAKDKYEAKVGKKLGKNLKKKFRIGNAAAGKKSFAALQVTTDEATLKQITNDPAVAYYEKDSVFTSSVVKSNVKDSKPLNTRAMTSQAAKGIMSWPLGRISHRQKGLNEYIYDDSACAGTRIYLVGSGIRVSHQEFDGRAIWGTNFVSNSPDTDEAGSGTHTAGVIVGKTIGVCKKAKIVAVKVLDSNGSGSTSRIIDGLKWAARDAQNRGVKAVIQITSNGDRSSTMNSAVQAVIDQNIPVVVSAGMDGEDAYNHSPASAPGAITVGATDQADVRVPASNYGSVIDIFAPGFNVYSCGIASDTAYLGKTGTGVAAGYISGLAAYYMALENISDASRVRSRLVSRATTGAVTNLNGSPNVLAFNNASN